MASDLGKQVSHTCVSRPQLFTLPPSPLTPVGRRPVLRTADSARSARLSGNRGSQVPWGHLRMGGMLRSLRPGVGGGVG